jgi:hypothetical protein
VAGTAGSVKFYGRGNTEATRWKFTGDVAMGGSQDNILFSDRGADKDLNTIFTGGLKTSQQPLGLPHHEGYIEYARSLAEGSLDIEIKGDPASAYAGSNAPAGKVPDVVKIAGDARPSFAKILITLDGDRVKVEKVNPGKPGLSEQIYNGLASNVPHGIISVQGGNVEVQSAFNRNTGEPVPFNGNLTIVSSDNPGRARPDTGSKSYPQNNGTIYSDAARAYYTENPHLTPPYTEREVYGASGSSTKYVWPSPVGKVEREGNTMMTSDIRYGSGTRPPALGVVAENFVLLNDKNPSGDPNGLRELRLDAVLMSLNHSVQFDWDNMARSDTAVHNQLMQRDKSRTFRLNGAIVSGFLDVEGDVLGRGYYDQKFTHDKNLRFQLPPSFPRWDRATSNAAGVVWSWVIMNYVDKGTLNQFQFN